jgi:urease accessory protein
MRILLGLLATLISTSAFAHTGHGDASGLMHGLMHPISGLDHVLAMVAVGVLAYLTGGRMRLALPLSFMSAMLVGGLLGMSGFQLPLVGFRCAAAGLAFIGLDGFLRRLPWFCPRR